MRNMDIRIRVSESGIHYKDIAAKLGISPEWLSKLMSRELSPERRQQIKQAIMELKDDTRNS